MTGDAQNHFVCNHPYSWSRDDGKKRRLWRFGQRFSAPMAGRGPVRFQVTKQAWQQREVQALAPTRT